VSLIESGAQGGADAFAHFHFTAPLATLARTPGEGTAAFEAFSNVDTNEDVDQIVGGGGGFSFLPFLFWGDGRPASHTCG
jgi:hypothetical protein